MFITCNKSGCDGYQCRYAWNVDQDIVPCPYCGTLMEVAE